MKGYRWIDGKGLRRYESFCVNVPAIYYRDDISTIKSIEYAFKHSCGASSGTAPPETKEDGYIHLGNAVCTGVMRAGDVVTFTIKWNGKEETLELSIKPDSQEEKDEIKEKTPEYTADRVWVTLGE